MGQEGPSSSLEERFEILQCVVAFIIPIITTFTGVEEEVVFEHLVFVIPEAGGI